MVLCPAGQIEQCRVGLSNQKLIVLSKFADFLVKPEFCDLFRTLILREIFSNY